MCVCVRERVRCVSDRVYVRVMQIFYRQKISNTIFVNNVVLQFCNNFKKVKECVDDMIRKSIAQNKRTAEVDWRVVSDEEIKQSKSWISI